MVEVSHNHLSLCDKVILTTQLIHVVVVQIISQKDEHCWVGELNGLRGWFPAKFVQILDERSKEVNTQHKYCQMDLIASDLIY